MPIRTGQSVLIEMNTGIVNILGMDGEELTISGKTVDLERTNYEVLDSRDQIHIKANYHKSIFSRFPDPPLELNVHLPQESTLRVETFDANVLLLDLRGSIAVDSVTGDIEAENVAGIISLRSGRGNIRAINCSGEVTVLGEHGILSIEDSRGDLGASTIMGSILFSGEPVAGDMIRLETDHGPIRIDLGEEISLDFSVNTTSGNLVCEIPGLDASTRSCSGTFGRGEGEIWVRTVSGDVTVQIAP